MARKINAAFIIIGIFLLSACNLPTSGRSSLATVTPETDPVAPILLDYYQKMGGEARLGGAISALFGMEQAQCQYTTNVLMCYHPLEKESTRFSLEAVGEKIIQKEAAPLSPELESPRVEEGYPIYPAFIRLFDEMGGIKTTGSPLSAPRYNYARQQIEQYFMKVGFMVPFDQAGDVRLMPYGVITCKNCASNGQFSAPQIFPASPFSAGLETLGGTAVFGLPLTEVYAAPDGNSEQVFENAIVFVTVKNEIHLRALPVLLEKPSASPTAMDASVQGSVFYAVSDGLGYMVPTPFHQFIEEHGGLSLSGKPLSSAWMENDIPHQCFENYCLEYHAGAPLYLRTRLSPLGVEYLQKTGAQASTPAPSASSDATATVSPSDEKMILQVYESSPEIRPGNQMIIRAVVLKADDQTPAAGISGSLTLTLPDGETQKYEFPISDGNGSSQMTLPPAPTLPNGSVLTYRVCFGTSEETAVCGRGAYLIWK